MRIEHIVGLAYDRLVGRLVRRAALTVAITLCVIVAIYQFTVAGSLVVQAHYGSVEAHLFVGAVYALLGLIGARGHARDARGPARNAADHARRSDDAWLHFGSQGPPGVLARTPLPPPGITLEKQRLAEYSRYRRWLKRLGDEKCRLRPFARQETLGVGSDEYDRHLE